MYIYLDESGDLGFDYSKDGTSEKFTLTLLVCDSLQSKKAIKKAVSRTIKNKIKGKRKIDKTFKELKGTNTSAAVKAYFYRQIQSDGWGLYTVILNKRRVYSQFHPSTGQSKLYNFLSGFIIQQLPLNHVQTNVHLIVDKSKNRAEIRDFNQYLQNYIEGQLPLNTGLTIEHLGSHEDPGLQAVDLFCWGIARKYNLQDTQWYDQFAEKIRFEDEYLKSF
jgi:hypothetical protein